MKKTALALMMTALCGVAIAAAPEPMAAPQSVVPAASGLAGAAKTTPATPVGTAPAAVTAAGTVTATCKDGTTFSGTSKRGACSGHKGVKSFAGTETATDAKAESKQESKERGQRASALLRLCPQQLQVGALVRSGSMKSRTPIIARLTVTTVGPRRALT